MVILVFLLRDRYVYVKINPWTKGTIAISRTQLWPSGKWFLSLNSNSITILLIN